MSINGLTTNTICNQYPPKRLDTASELVGFDIDKYVFEDTFEKSEYNPLPTNNFDQGNPLTRNVDSNKKAGLLALGALAVGTIAAIKFGKNINIKKP